MRNIGICRLCNKFREHELFAEYVKCYDCDWRSLTEYAGLKCPKNCSYLMEQTVVSVGKQFASDQHCQHCGQKDETVELVSSCTAYVVENPYDIENNPNRMIFLCRTCAEEHYEYWREMWREYFDSRR